LISPARRFSQPRQLSRVAVAERDAELEIASAGSNDGYEIAIAERFANSGIR